MVTESTFEALPLPLFVVCELEWASVTSEEEVDRFLIACFLTMLWAGLRFSDAQRVDLSSLQLSDGSLKAWCWRSKTSPTGFHGVVLCAAQLGLSGVTRLLQPYLLFAGIVRRVIFFWDIERGRCLIPRLFHICGVALRNIHRSMRRTPENSLCVASKLPL